MPPIRAKLVREWSYFLAGKPYNVTCQVVGSHPSAYTKAKIGGQRELKVADFEVIKICIKKLLAPAKHEVLKFPCKETQKFAEDKLQTFLGKCGSRLVSVFCVLCMLSQLGKNGYLLFFFLHEAAAAAFGVSLLVLSD